MNTPPVDLCILAGFNQRLYGEHIYVVPRKTGLIKGKMFVVQLAKNANWKGDFSGSDLRFSLMDFVFPITI